MPVRYEAVPNEDGGWKIVALPVLPSSDPSPDRSPYQRDLRAVLPTEALPPVKTTASSDR